MCYLLIRSLAIASLVLAGLAFPPRSQATSILLPGWDLLGTQGGTTFGGVPFQGVPLGSYDFGGGPQNVGNADTIVRRLAQADVVAPGNSDTIPIELVALHLQSAVPADFGVGLGTYFMTLQSERGGPASVGQMTINFGPEGNPHGTFDSFFDVFFDIRLGGLNGPIALSDSLTLTSSGTPWSHDAPPGAILIDGVNHQLNGVDNGEDFWPAGSINGSFPNGALIVSGPATTSVPDAGATWSLLLIALVFCGLAQLIQKANFNPQSR